MLELFLLSRSVSRERRGIGLQNIKRRLTPLHFIAMDLSLSPSVSDTVCVLWGCELNDTQRNAVFEIAEDLLEHQFFIRTMCLSAEASKEMHVVEVQDRVGECCKPVPIATLHPMCQPMVSFSGFELKPPVLFNLRSGQGPLFISGQHLTLVYEEEEEEKEEEEKKKEEKKVF
ncbi:nucleoplasmin isoform X1 [Oncorhynchus tshawytscha]|uniref:nucleoplasmin isoform X1 n=2 Tax=Oncorhynchus tshawytscha TaxID=74940 RepID=UPI001C3DACE0|nr:nucleoplasmin isoform X1 [Oncorhynchus tshawytscha]